MLWLMNLLKNEISVLFFDYGGTLDANGMAWRSRFLLIYQAVGKKWRDDAVFRSAFYRADDVLLDPKYHQFSLSEIVREQVYQVLLNMDEFDKKTHQEVVDRFMDSSLRQIEMNKKVLTYLKQKYALGIISNNYGNLAEILKETGLTHFFEIAIDSTRVGFMKPDPSIFKKAIQDMGCSMKESVYIGDSFERDMLGAKNVGMDHIWLNPKYNKNQQSVCCPGDRVIRDLSQLMEYF